MAAEQGMQGDRLRLHLPASVAVAAWDRQQKAASEDDRLRSVIDPRALPVRRGTLGVFYVDTFAGCYLDVDLAASGPSSRAWPNPFRRTMVQHLALTALGALDVSRLTGAHPADATMFLLCDRPCGQPYWFSWSQTGRCTRMWAWDAFHDG